jgi:hypothetical protein
LKKQVKTSEKKVDKAENSENEEEKMARDEIEDDEGLGEDNMEAEFGEQEDEEEEDEKESGYVVEEESLDFEKFLFRYTHPHILRCYIMMLGEYTKNSDFVNRCCMNMFERIAYECHAPQCLYQLSLFHLINKLYKDPMSRCMMNIMDDRKYANSATSQIYSSTYSSEDMFAFFRQLMGKFFEQAKKNPKLFLEVLFFKDKKIVYELGEDSNGYEPLEFKASGGKRAVAWTPEEEEELKGLFEK